MPATFLLRTRNLTASMSGPLMTISDHLERSVSWPERTMLLEVLISMFSAISDENFDHDEPTSLMLEASTRTLNGLSAILARVHSTRARMEILLQEDSTSLASPLVLFQQLKIRGLLLSARRVNENFSNLLRTSVLGTSSRDLGACTPTQSGNGPNWLNHMRVPPGSPLQMELFLTWLAGEVQLWNTEVSYLVRRSGETHGPSRPSGLVPRRGARAITCTRGRFFFTSLLGVAMIC